MKVSYSYFSEDMWLNRAFPDNNSGFYINIGANHPAFGSVTKFFYDKGWRGINVEPLPDVFNQLVKVRTRDINLQLAVSDKQGVANFFKDAQSLERSFVRGGNSSEEIVVKIDTLENICEKYLPDDVIENGVDFLAIDAEGHESNIIYGANWKKYRPKVLMVEAIKPFALMKNPVADADNALWHQWEPYLLEQGYIFVQFDGVNRYYVRQEDEHLRQNFIIPIHPHLDLFEIYDQRDSLRSLLLSVLRRFPILYKAVRSVYRAIFR